MKILAEHHSNQSPLPAISFDFTAPGGTIGRCAGNQLVLDDPDQKLGRIQAVVRIDGELCTLANVSSQGNIHINGRELAMDEAMVVAAGADITIGSYRISLLETTQADDSDIFKSLLEGPGVLPVGGEPDQPRQHPFEMDSAITRNHPNPIEQLKNEGRSWQHHGEAAAPLQVEPESESGHIFSDNTPSTLNLDDPLAPHRKNDIHDALELGHENKEGQENR